MGVSKLVPSPNSTDFEAVFRRQEPKSSVQTILVPRSENELAASSSVTKSICAGDRPASPATETLQTFLVPRSENELAENSSVTKSDFEGDRPAPPATEPLQTIWVPRSENELAANFRVTKSDFEGDCPTSSAPETRNEPVTDVPPPLSPHVTGPEGSTTPASEGLFHTFNSSKKKSPFSGRSVAVSATLAFMVGIAAGVIWPWNLTLASSTATTEQLIVNQLNAIAEELSSLRRDLKNLTAGHQHITEAQEQLAAAQARLAAAQEQWIAKQNHVPSTQVNRSRKNRP
jgi:hypothetical protein